MKKIKLFLASILLVLSNISMATNIGIDKFYHFGGIALITSTTYLLTDDVKFAVMTGIGIGLAKELYDSRKGGSGFSYNDLFADSVGCAVGLGTGFLINWAF